MLERDFSLCLHDETSTACEELMVSGGIPGLMAQGFLIKLLENIFKRYCKSLKWISCYEYY